MSKRKHYLPPPAHVIEQCVKAICQTLAKTDEQFAHPDIVAGFTEYVKVVSAITVRTLNEQNNSDVEPDVVDKVH